MITIAIPKDEKKIGTLEKKVMELAKTLIETREGDIYKKIFEKVERPLIEYVLTCADGNQLKASRILGINRNTMRTKVKKFGIDPAKWKI